MAAGARGRSGNGSGGPVTLADLSLDLIRIATALSDLAVQTGTPLILSKDRACRGPVSKDARTPTVIPDTPTVIPDLIRDPPSPPNPLILSSRRACRDGVSKDVASLIAERQARAAAFGLPLAHPGWSLLLELYRAHLAPSPLILSSDRACRERVSKDHPEPVERGMRTTRLAAAARVSLTSTLRWLDRLAAAGLIQRRPDPTHENGVLVTLTPAGAEAMARHFNERAAS